MQKGQALILIIVGLLIIAVVAGGAYYLGRSTFPKSLPAPVVTSPAATQRGEQTSQPSPIKDASPAPAGAGETANWKTYTDNETGIQFKYPSDLEVYKETKDSLFVGSFSIGKYVNPNLPGVPSIDRIDIQVQSKDSKFLIDERKVLFGLEIGESGDVSSINTKQFGKGWIFKRLPDIYVDGIQAKSFISDGLWQAPSGSVDRRIYVQKANNIYMIRGYLVGGDINENVFNNLMKTFKFLQ